MAAKTGKLKSLGRQLSTARKKLASALTRLRKAKAKPKAKPKVKAKVKAKQPPKAPKASKPAAKPKPTKQPLTKEQKGRTRHDLGKAELSWYPWERLEKGRFARYGIGLNGDNQGKSVIVLFAEQTPDGWKWEVYPKDDYGDLLPEKYADGMGGTSTSQNAAKQAADSAVGL